MTTKPSKSDSLTKAEVADLLTSLTPYEDEYKLAADRITMRGKSLAEAQKEQTAWPVFYGVRRAELAIKFKRMEVRVYAIRGRLHRFYKEHDALG
ncbi:hypothetical protein E4H12_13715, partial [Candidatus Thorarchaeota archaeon]